MTATQYRELRTIFNIAYYNYQKDLRARAFFKVNNPFLGEDLVQNTFMKTWSYLIKGGRIEKMRAFLYKILDNCIVDEYRKRKTSSLDVMQEKGFDLPNPSSENISETLDQKRILQFVDCLPAKYKKVVNMRYIQELSIEEISAQMNQSKNAVTVQIHRGLEKLKVLYPPL